MPTLTDPSTPRGATARPAVFAPPAWDTLPTPRLIALDMDGTLLNSEGRVSARNLAALRHAEAAGAEVVIATGRRHTYAMRVLRDLSLAGSAALVSSNGTVIRTVGDATLIHRTHLPLSTARWLCEHVRPFRSTLVLTFDTVQPDGEDLPGALAAEHVDDLHASIGRWMETNARYFLHVPSLDALLTSPGVPAPIQMMLCGPVSRMREAEAWLLTHPLVASAESATPNLAAEIILHRTEYPDRDLCIVDILPAGSSKASAIAHLAQLRGITVSEILAMGDNWNDLPMLHLAGRPVLMANAPSPLRELAATRNWRIAPTNDEDGVAQTLETLF